MNRVAPVPGEEGVEMGRLSPVNTPGRLIYVSPPKVEPPKKKSKKGVVGTIAGLKARFAKMLKKVPEKKDRYDDLGTDLSKVRKKFFIDAGLFALFLALYLTILLAERDNVHSYLLGQQIQHKFVTQNLQAEPPFVVDDQTFIEKTFLDISLVEDWYNFIFGIFYSNMYQMEWYNGDEFTDLNKQEGGWPLYANKVVGAIRLRQVRVKQQSCDLAPSLAGYVDDCYPPFSSKVESKDDFVLTENATSATTLYWQSEADLKGSFFWGRVTTYPGSGFVVDIPSNDSDIALETLRFLYESTYIDDQTRLVLIDFVVYNANTDLSSWVRLATEFPAVGGAIPTFAVRTHRIFQYEHSLDYFIAFCQVSFCLLLVYYIVTEVREAMKLGPQLYVSDFWNWLDWINYAAFVAVIGLRIQNIVAVNNYDWQPDPLTFVNYEQLFNLLSQETNINAFNALIMFFRLYKYLYVFPQLRVFIQTLGESMTRIVSFMVVFCVVLVGFALALYIAMGRDIYNFSDVGYSMFTLFQATLGVFEFSEFQQGNRILGPLFFITYQIIIFFVLLNVFIAIIDQAYQSLDAEIQDDKRKASVVEQAVYHYFREKVAGLRDRLVKYAYVVRLADQNGDGRIDADELRKLKESVKDFPDLLEILNQADANNDLQLDPTEVEALMAKLESALQQTENPSSAETAASATPGRPSVLRGQSARDLIHARLTRSGAALNVSGEAPVGSASALSSPGRMAADPGAERREDMLRSILSRLTQFDLIDRRLQTIEQRMH
eukprot:TRINITY_DN9069_c0_g2_i1.p1 TRINITY_DN9069_c0_g2~~TRINITY_DN9069_c0_g2_i1.p1  ORF type:complete len:774 (-),score=272.45 TRINITY_DN9069_c0_g2_i1:740-3061(-)